MGKTYKRDNDEDAFVLMDEDFMDMDSDDDYDYLFESRARRKRSKVADGSKGRRRVASSRHLPDDWQDFAYGLTESESYSISDWR